ncbi:MAG: hypothetical protein J0G33_05055 [Afipia felis]|nr:hypothetical protein [Afipia felis]
MISLRSDNTLTAKAALMRLFKAAGMACALTLVVASNVARAEDDGEQQPEMSFEHKMIDGLLRGLGGQTMEDNNKGIEYRERSPLVIPSKLDLPPPASKSAPAVANWPKDPDVQARKEAIEASKRATPDWDDAKRPLMPSELAKKPSSKRSATALNDDRPGMDNSNYNLLSPSQLGFKNSMMSDLFGGGKDESAKFVKEPDRSELSQPPAGYQTPSPSYAYGTGPMESKTKRDYNPIFDNK